MKKMFKNIFSVAKKEFWDNFNNKWILLLTAIFFALTVLVSFYGTASGGENEWKSLQRTIVDLASYVELMVPILAIMLGYGSIAREKEKGSLELLLSYPIERGEVLAGKFLGLWALLVVVISIGLGLGGMIIAFKVTPTFWPDYYFFVLSSVLLGGVYISLSMFCSVLLKNSRTSMLASLFLLFLFAFIWLGGMYALAESTFGWETIKEGNPPRWYFGLQFFNPVVIWFTLLALSIPPFRAWAMEFGSKEPQAHPPFFDIWIMIAVLLLWIAVPLILSEYVFDRKDIL